MSRKNFWFLISGHLSHSRPLLPRGEPQRRKSPSCQGPLSLSALLGPQLTALAPAVIFQSPFRSPAPSQPAPPHPLHSHPTFIFHAHPRPSSPARALLTCPGACCPRPYPARLLDQALIPPLSERLHCLCAGRSAQDRPRMLPLTSVSRSVFPSPTHWGKAQLGGPSSPSLS